MHFLEQAERHWGSGVEWSGTEESDVRFARARVFGLGSDWSGGGVGEGVKRSGGSRAGDLVKLPPGMDRGTMSPRPRGGDFFFPFYPYDA